MMKDSTHTNKKRLMIAMVTKSWMERIPYTFLMKPAIKIPTYKKFISKMMTSKEFISKFMTSKMFTSKCITYKNL